MDVIPEDGGSTEDEVLAKPSAVEDGGSKEDGCLRTQARHMREVVACKPLGTWQNMIRNQTENRIYIRT